MRCKTCNYALWNLPGRTCPECGTPFKPSDFEFIPSAVKFCCRQCMQPYYGTTWQGHLMPIAFTCVSCGAPVHMDETVILPTEGVDESKTVQGTNPWLDKRRGRFSRFFTAIGHAMVRPSEMARGTPRGSSVGAAAGFAFLVSLLTYTICFVPQLAISFTGGPAVAGSFLMLIGIFVALTTIGLWLWALVAHVLLKVTGPTAGGMRETFLALYYSAGANIFSAVPCAGFLFGWIWWVVSAAAMLREFQRIGSGRAALAALFPPLVVVGLLVGGYMWMISSVMSRAMTAARAAQATAVVTPGGVGTLPGAGTHSPSGVGTGVLDAVRAWASAVDGQIPDHPAELAAYRYIPLDGWFVAASGSSDKTATIGGRSLRELDLLPPGERVEAFRGAIERDGVLFGGAGTPSGWRRLGDVLLPEMGGVTLAEAADLWVVVVSPDPDAGTVSLEQDGFTAIQGDGTIVDLAAPDVAGAIARENAARAGAGLAPLQDPRQVRHAAPPGG